MSQTRHYAGDWVLDKGSQDWMANLKERLARQRQNPQLVEKLFQELDGLYVYSKEVKYYTMWPHNVIKT